MRLLALLFLALRLTLGAADVDNASALRPVISDEERRAASQMQAMERTLADLQTLDPDKRREREGNLERPLEKLLSSCSGTKHENKAIYLLASWRAGYGDYRDVGALLDRLDACGYPAYKQAGQLLRVDVLLHDGRVAEARVVATAAIAKVPEFAAVLTLVAFHERVGQPAPRTAGRTIEGTLLDPASRSEPWLVYLFVDSIAGESAAQLGRWLSELARPGYAGKARVVCVAFTANGLAAATAMRALPGAESADLLWIDPAQGAELAAWQQDWSLPAVPAVAILGPDRRIVAVQAQPTALRGLVAPGAKPKERATTPKGGNPWGR
ncbi:MAG: hypothetical protein H0W72_16055 [Planctomycetes bacterium]|nr:hypothetical protein [Planctomycetota bacterium]